VHCHLIAGTYTIALFRYRMEAGGTVSTVIRWNRAAQGIAAIAGVALCGIAGIIAPQAQASPAASNPYSWHVAKVFAGQPYANLIPMTAISAKDAWLFGDGAHKREVALHWNGSTWTPSYPFGTLPRPWYVSSTGASNVWVTGQACTNSGANYVSRYNGKKWTTTTFKIAGGAFCQSPVVTTGRTNGWIFSKSAVATKALHFTGKKWVAVTLGKFGAVVAASAVSATDIYLLTYTQSAKMLVVRYNGRTWKSIPVPAAPAPRGDHPYPDAITTPSRTNVWVATDLVRSAPGGGGYEVNASRVLHLDGSRWSWVKVPGTDNTYNIAYSAGVVWLAGQRPLATGTGWDFLRWNGKTWASVPVPSAGVPGTDVSYQIYSLVHIPGTHSFWAEGDSSYQSPSNQQEAAAVVFKYGP
jgi:hypothetical protein